MSTQSKATATAVLADSDAASTEHRTIHGVAISDNEITNGLHGKKKWVPEELEKAASTLKGSTLTASPDLNDIEIEGALIDTNHGERVRVGQITDSAYEDDVGVVYEMDVESEPIYSALALGDLDISIEASDPSDVDEDPETGALIMRDYVFDGMDVVERGAARSNHTAAGPASNNQAIAALSAQDVNDMLEEHNEADLVAALESSIHTPSYSGTTTSSPSWADGSWERPSKSQFDSDDLSEIGQHFIASTSGFDSPDSYSDLKLPVVEPNGNLNLNGLEAANSRVSQTSGLSDDAKSSAQSKIRNLAEDEFDEDWGEDEDEEAANEQAAAEEGEDEDEDVELSNESPPESSDGDVSVNPSTGEVEPADGDGESDPDQEDSAGDTDDPNSEGEVSAEDGSDDDNTDSQSTADTGSNDSGTDVKSESDMQESPESDDPDEEVENAGDDDPEEPESTPGPESSDEDGNSDEDAETSAEGGEDDPESGADEANETDSTMSTDNSPDDEESNENENEEEETQSQEQAGLNLDGQVVIDEDRHDELKTKAAMAEDLEDENEDLKRTLNKREEQIGVVNEVYNAALADAGPHTQEFYEDTPLETKQKELANIHGVSDEEDADAAALSESVENSNEQALPQTGDQGPGDEPDEAALEEANEKAEAALKLDDMAALSQSDKSANEFVKDTHGKDPADFDNDIELRDAIYNSGAAAGGDD